MSVSPFITPGFVPEHYCLLCHVIVHILALQDVPVVAAGLWFGAGEFSFGSVTRRAFGFGVFSPSVL